MPAELSGIPFQLIARLMALAFFAILFLQSSLDKITDRKGNLEYLNSVFAKSPLKNSVGFLFPVITLLELAAGTCCAIGALLLGLGNSVVGTIGLLLSCSALLCLFFGQRVANDYAGAASLAAYFAVALLGLVLFL